MLPNNPHTYPPDEEDPGVECQGCKGTGGHFEMSISLSYGDEKSTWIKCVDCRGKGRIYR